MCTRTWQSHCVPSHLSHHIHAQHHVTSQSHFGRARRYPHVGECTLPLRVLAVACTRRKEAFRGALRDGMGALQGVRPTERHGSVAYIVTGHMNAWGDPTHHPKRQLDRFTHFHTTMQQMPHWLEWDAPNLPKKLPNPLQR